jgi:Flp pilus assembly protein TadB
MTAGVVAGVIAAVLTLLLGAPVMKTLAPQARTVAAGEPPDRLLGRRWRQVRRGFWQRRRAQQSTAAALPCVIDLLDDLAADVRSGGALRGSLESAAAAQIDHGRTAAAARTRIAHAILDSIDSPTRGTRLTSEAAVATQAITAALLLGGSQALALDSAASLLRERHAVALERAAHSAQARLSARVMTIVPAAFTGWVLLTNDQARAATATPFGSAALATGILLNVTGWAWMRRVVRVRS